MTDARRFFIDGAPASWGGAVGKFTIDVFSPPGDFHHAQAVNVERLQPAPPGKDRGGPGILGQLTQAYSRPDGPAPGWEGPAAASAAPRPSLGARDGGQIVEPVLLERVFQRGNVGLGLFDAHVAEDGGDRRDVRGTGAGR